MDSKVHLTIRHRVLRVLDAQGRAKSKVELFHRARGRRREPQAAPRRAQQLQLRWQHVQLVLPQPPHQHTVHLLHHAAAIVRTLKLFNVRQRGGHGGQQVLLEITAIQVDQ